MLSHFAILGDLYKHDPYDTLATEWNTYPWAIGQDNYLDQVESEAESATMEKMLWRLNDDEYFNVVRPSAIISTIDMWAALISIDNFGQLGSQAGIDPEPIPDEELDITITNAEITSVEITSSLKINYQSEGLDGLDRVTITNAEITSAVIGLVLINGLEEEGLDATGRVSITNAEITTVAIIAP